MISDAKYGYFNFTFSIPISDLNSSNLVGCAGHGGGGGGISF